MKLTRMASPHLYSETDETWCIAASNLTAIGVKENLSTDLKLTNSGETRTGPHGEFFSVPSHPRDIGMHKIKLWVAVDVTSPLHKATILHRNSALP
jgi:hypothetical protein